MNILSIQSWVSYGHVGNAAAVFPLQRMGHNVSAIHTVQFSNHTGYGSWRGQVFEPSSITEIVEGLTERGVLKSFDAVLSGYAGAAGTVNAVLEAVKKVRAENPNLIYCLDPVMGDVGRGVFVKPEIPELIGQQSVPLADVVTPNQFELELLTGQKILNMQDAIAAANLLRAKMHGPRIVLLTSLMRADNTENQIETLCIDDSGAHVVATPILQFDPAPNDTGGVTPNGMGDVMAALFLGHYLASNDVAKSGALSLQLAVSGLYALLVKTKELGSRELGIVAAQAKLVGPTKIFSVKKLD